MSQHSGEPASNLVPSPSDMFRMYRRMLLIRRAEEKLGDEFKVGRLPASPHLYIGQEAVAVGVCDHLGDRDWIASTHRGHGHFLAKGGDLTGMFAEIHGKLSGVCKGMGGSMHVADFSRGIIGANGIVGAGIPLTLGAALAAQLDGAGKVGVSFFGDGASNQGVFAESMNIAALWKLPIIFVCENNGWSEFSAAATVTAGVIAERAGPLGLPFEVIDGNDLEAVWRSAAIAIERARSGLGATVIEARTYRLRGHVEAESSFLSRPYRDAAEVENWRARDPLDATRMRLLETGAATSAELCRLEVTIAEAVASALMAAEAADFPPLENAVSLAFADRRI